MVLTLLNPFENVWEANTYGFGLIEWSVVSDHCTDWYLKQMKNTFMISIVTVTENLE